MAFPNPFAIPEAQNSPYLQYLAGVGGSYDALRRQGAGLPAAGNNLVAAGQRQIGPGEFDPSVARLLDTAERPVNNDIEDYFFRKYMADANSRVASRGLIGQGAGEGLLNEAAKNYAFGRADTASGRTIAAANAASGLRTGQVGRAASLTGAGLRPYDTLRGLLTGQGSAYLGAGELGNQVGIANARNQTALTPSYLNAYGNLAGRAAGAVGGLYNQFTSGGGGDTGVGGGTQSAGADVLRDTGGGDSGGDWIDTIGGFFDAKGGQVPGRGAYDHVRAVLTPKEFVIRRPVAQRARPALESLNAGDFGGAARKLARVAAVAR